MNWITDRFPNTQGVDVYVTEKLAYNQRKVTKAYYTQGKWYDEYSQECENVIAWTPNIEPYYGNDFLPKQKHYNKLEKCPFCGEENVHLYHEVTEMFNNQGSVQNINAYKIECPSCEAIINGEDVDELIERWNNSSR